MRASQSSTRPIERNTGIPAGGPINRPVIRRKSTKETRSERGRVRKQGEVARRRRSVSTSELSKSRTHNLHTSPSKRVNFSTASHILSRIDLPPSGDSLFPLHRFSFPPLVSTFTTIRTRLIVRPAHWRGATNYWSSIEARGKTWTASVPPPPPFLRHSLPRNSVDSSFPIHGRLHLSVPFSSSTFSSVSGLFLNPLGYGATLRKRRGKIQQRIFTFLDFSNYLEFPARRIRPSMEDGWKLVWRLLIPILSFFLSLASWLNYISIGCIALKSLMIYLSVKHTRNTSCLIERENGGVRSGLNIHRYVTELTYPSRIGWILTLGRWNTSDVEFMLWK